MWLDDQYRVCRKAEPRYPAARGSDRAPGEHALPGRSGLARSVDAVSRLSQLRLAPREPSPTVVGSRSHERSWRSQAVVYTTAADNSLNPQTRYNVLLTPSSAGALPWYQPSFSTTSGSWRWCASS